MNELQKLHQMVWRFRAVMEPHWATPGPVDCLRYAFCEAGEAMDAWLRQQRPNDSRNNERQPDVLDELADCAIMLLSAVPEVNWEIARTELFPLEAIDKLPQRLGELFKCFQSAFFVDDAVFTVSLIANYQDMNLEERIVGRLWKIAHKHAPAEVFSRAVDVIYE